MPSITLELPVTDTVVSAGLHATNYADIQALLNGALDGSNIAASTVLAITSATLSGAAGLVLSGAGGNDTLNLSNTAAGTGITIGGDVAIYRDSADIFETTDRFNFVKAAASIALATLLADGDANPAWSIKGDGRIEWGTGGASAVDTKLSRSSAGTLDLSEAATADGQLRLQTLTAFAGGGAGNTALRVFNLSSHSNPTWRVDGNGDMWFGAGDAAAVNVKLYWGGNDILKTDDVFSAVRIQLVNSGDIIEWTQASAVQTTVGAAGGASALPATPTGYIKVKDSGGTQRVVPYYAAA